MADKLYRNFRYKFQKGSRKSICPKCRKRTFNLFVDSYTGKELPENYGRCDREVKCGYFYSPYHDKNYKSEKKISGDNYLKENKSEEIYIPRWLNSRLQSSSRYPENKFLQNLLTNIPYPFDYNDIVKVSEMYRLGTIVNGNMKGAITFPFIDPNQNITAIQVKLFDQINHTKKMSWIHSMLESELKLENYIASDWVKNYNLNWINKYNDGAKIRSFFGTHLLEEFSLNKIGLVEAPKTAVVATLCFGFPHNPENFLWLATGSLSYFNTDRCKYLAERDIVMFPDLSKNGTAAKKWKSKAELIRNEIPGINFEFSTFLENNSSFDQKSKGLDLADFLLNWDWRKMRNDLQSNNISKNDRKQSIINEHTIDTRKFLKDMGLSKDILIELFACIDPEKKYTYDRMYWDLCKLFRGQDVNKTMQMSEYLLERSGLFIDLGTIKDDSYMHEFILDKYINLTEI